MHVFKEDIHKLTLCSVLFKTFGEEGIKLFLQITNLVLERMLEQSTKHIKTISVWFARSHDLVSKWIPPPTSWFSIKFDAAIRPHSTFTTAAVRNESGEVFLALRIFSHHLIQPKHKQQFRQSNWLFFVSFPLFSLKETLTVSLRLQDLPSSPPWFLAPFLPKLKADLNSISYWSFSFG